MSYSTPEMVRKAVAPSASADGALPANATHTAADLSNAQLADAIAEADSTIDSYIGRFYTTPVEPEGDPAAIPHPIDFWSRNIAAYNATLTYRGSQDLSEDDPISRRYRATMEALKAVNAGSAQLLIGLNEGDHSAASAAAPYNPLSGDLFTVDDFDLRPPNFDPVYGVAPSPFWRDR